jgi:signal transduction histidine kinase
MSMTFREITHPEDLEISNAQVESLISGRIQRVTLEKRYLHRTGRTLRARIGIFLQRDPSANPEFFIVHVQDLTRAKEMEAQLLQARKLQAVGTLAGGIAHDFNNILYPILGYAEMTLEDVPEDGPLANNLREILRAGMRASDLVRQILTFSRTNEQDRKPLSIQPLVAEVLKLLRPALPSGVELAADLPDTDSVMADPAQIHQVLMNLCTNACHAMRETGGELRVNLSELAIAEESEVIPEDLSPGTYVVLTVQDAGVGMDADILQKIFDPYFTTKEVGDGSGLDCPSPTASLRTTAA